MCVHCVERFRAENSGRYELSCELTAFWLVYEVLADFNGLLLHPRILCEGLTHETLECLFSLWGCDCFRDPVYAKAFGIAHKALILDSALQKLDERLVDLLIFKHTLEILKPLLFDLL